MDTAALARGLRASCGRLHVFESHAEAPAGSGLTYLAVPSGRVTRSTVEELATRRDLLPPPEVPGDDGGGPTHVVALPYEREAAGFVEEVDAVVAVRDDEVRVRGDLPEVGVVPPPAEVSIASQQVDATMDRERFERAVRSIVASIAAGDVYLVNLTWQLRSAWPGDVHDLYRALRATSPAPHGAVIETAPGVGLASISPETFIRAVGRDLTIRPIKGTRPRADDPAEDARLADELAGSEKERAENVMVVDLERNDLGQVCEIGSVEVPRLCEVEGHPTVWQLVSTVTGRLRRDLSYGDALSACAPCGSVTGAPKTSAVRIAAALERSPRGWYCGALGWMAPGRVELAVAIRTSVVDADGTATYGTGAGIVADSDPRAEFDETWAKAVPFLRAVNDRIA